MEKKKRQKGFLAVNCENEERSLSDEAQKSATRAPKRAVLHLMKKGI